jgi:SAM-dependent methyltransferase
MNEMIDRSLNYGRHHIRSFLKKASSADLIVDLGAGVGDDLLSARKIWPRAKLKAVENWAPNIESLEKSGISVLPLDIERDRLPFDDESVDVFIANQVLEHAKEVYWIFHEVSRTLKRGGIFIIGVPNLAALHNRVLLAIGRQPSPIKTASAHVRGYTRLDIEEFLEIFTEGYCTEAFGGSNFYPFPPVIARKLAAIFPNLAWGIFLMLRKKKTYQSEFLKFPLDKHLETSFYLGPVAE